MTEDDARALVRGMTDTPGYKRLERLCDLVVEENGRQNLVSRATEGSMWVRHVLDSVQLGRLAKDRPGLWIDIGTGGGFPGLAVAAIEPDRSMMLVEPRRLRAAFLERAAKALGLDKVTVRQNRIESVDDARAAIISARAVASTEKLLHAARHCATPGTRWLLMRGRQGGEGKMFHVEQSLSDPEAHIAVIDGWPA